MNPKNINSIAFFGPSITSSDSTVLLDQIYKTGQEAAKRNITVLVPTEPGYPLWIAKGASNENGIVVAFDSRASRIEAEDIKLNRQFYSTVVYTNSSNAGRDLAVLNSSDAVIFLGLDAENISDLSMCAGEEKIIGLVESEWVKDAVIVPFIAEISKKTKIIRDKNPIALFDQIFDLLSLEN